MNDEGRTGRASRRQVLAGMGLLGAAGAAGVLGVSGATAAGAAPAPGSIGPPVKGGSAPVTGSAITNAFPADTPGLTYVVVAPYNFQPQQFANGLTFSAGVYTPNSAGFVIGTVVIPAGAVIKEWSATATNTTGSNQVMGLEVFNAGVGGSDTGLGFPSMTFPNAAGYQSVTVTLSTPYTVVSGDSVNVFGFTPINGTFKPWGARVGYVDPAPAFHPISPTRVYDSRWNPAPSGLTTGILTSPNSRVISAANGRDLSSGGVTAANVVPAGASAVSYNLTAIGGAGGFLAIAPGSAGSFSASAINWTTPGTVIANGGVVPLDGSRQVKVFAGGGGSADFLIDITGYYR